MAEFKAPAHIYLSNDRGRVVAEDDPDAGWLLAARGQLVAPGEVERLGLDRPARAPGRKAVPPTEDAAQDPAEDAEETPEDDAARERGANAALPGAPETKDVRPRPRRARKG